MPWSLKRFQNTRQTHFITFSCYHRHPMFTDETSRRLFESVLERVRRIFHLRVYAYVVMPEHVHILLSEPSQAGTPFKPDSLLNSDGAPFKPGFGLSGDVHTLADALKSLKQGVARRLIGAADHFWQKRYYDFNIRNHAQFVEKLHYIHCNPVKRGLCVRPEDWEWSSFRQYATGYEGRVEIESEWTARKRERAEGRLSRAIELPHSSQNRA